MNSKYAAGPTVVVYEQLVPTKKKVQKKGKTAIQNLLWGDEFDLLDETDGDWVRVKVRVGQGATIKPGWIKKSEYQDDPLLEVTFVDIGQGDGSLVITPDRDRHRRQKSGRFQIRFTAQGQAQSDSRGSATVCKRLHGKKRSQDLRRIDPESRISTHPIHNGSRSPNAMNRRKPPRPLPWRL